MHCFGLAFVVVVIGLVWFIQFYLFGFGFFFFLFSFVLFAGSHSISFISVSTQPLAIFWGGQGKKKITELQKNQVGTGTRQVTSEKSNEKAEEVNPL